MAKKENELNVLSDEFEVNLPVRVERNIQKLADIFAANPCNETFYLLEKRIRWGIRGHIFKIVQDDFITDEIYSKTLEHIYFNIGKYDKNKGKFSTWMYKIAYFDSLKFLTHGKVESYTLGIDFESIYDASMCSDCTDECDNGSSYSSQEMIDVKYDISIGKYIVYDRERLLNEIHDASIECIDYLPEKLRVVMKDRYVYNKKIREIAENNGFSMASVQNWLIKGKRVLAEELKNRYGYIYELYSQLPTS